MTRRYRRGFTLFQLLVVLAHSGRLASPYSCRPLAKVREAAARPQSQNNLKQIGLACHNYYSTNNVFPPGCNAKNFSTAVHLLPYIEQDNLYKFIDLKKSMDDKANAQVRMAVVKTFLNPMDPVMTVSDDFGATNYLFNAGSKPDLADNDGIFYLDSKITFADITDGTSNTLFFGETLKGDGGKKADDVRRQYVLLKKDALKGIKDDAGVQDFKDDKNIAGDRCASWMDGRFLQGTFTGTRTLNDAKPDVSCGGLGGLSGLRGPIEGVNIGFADGSVRFISQSVKPNIWKLLTQPQRRFASSTGLLNRSVSRLGQARFCEPRLNRQHSNLRAPGGSHVQTKPIRIHPISVAHRRGDPRLRLRPVVAGARPRGAEAKKLEQLNNLKQICLGTINFADTNQGTLPAGVDNKGFSAAAKILPYMEQVQVYNTIKFDKPITDDANAAAGRRRSRRSSARATRSRASATTSARHQLSLQQLRLFSQLADEVPGRFPGRYEQHHHARRDAEGRREG